MGIYEALFSALFNLFSLYISIRIIKLFLPARKTGKVFSASLCMGVWVFNWMLYYFFHIPDLTTMSLFFGLLAIAVLLFEGGIWRKGFAVIVSLATGIISENIVWKIFTGIPLLSGSEAAGAFCSVVLEFLILLCVERFVFIKRYKRLPAGIYANSLLIATGSAVLSEIIVLQAESKTAVWIGMSMICLINLSTYYTYEKNAESWEEKLRHAQMELRCGSLLINIEDALRLANRVNSHLLVGFKAMSRNDTDSLILHMLMILILNSFKCMRLSEIMLMN